MQRQYTCKRQHIRVRRQGFRLPWLSARRVQYAARFQATREPPCFPRHWDHCKMHLVSTSHAIASLSHPIALLCRGLELNVLLSRDKDASLAVSDKPPLQPERPMPVYGQSIQTSVWRDTSPCVPGEGDTDRQTPHRMIPFLQLSPVVAERC